MDKVDPGQARRREFLTPGSARGSLGATSRLGPLTQLPQVIEELGFAPSAVLADTGFEAAYFADPDMPIPYVTGSRLLAHCAKVTGCEHFGLLLGQTAGPAALGLPGLLMMSATSVGSALEDMVRHFELHDRGGRATLEKSGGANLVGFAIVEPGVDAPEQLQDLAMTIACNIMRGLCGEGWTPTEVLLPRRRPAESAPWKSFFRAPVRFGASRCALAFPSSWLGRPGPAANKPLHAYLEKQATAMRAHQSDLGFVGEVRRLVHGTIAQERCSAARVSTLLGMNPRTLNRRLLAEGTTFRSVRDDVLHGMARQLLEATSMNLAEVAHVLGYAEASSFIHAFSRWSGQTPQQWRAGVEQRKDKKAARKRAPAATGRPVRPHA
jgi:AraC-like DNA-binding protein